MTNQTNEIENEDPLALKMALRFSFTVVFLIGLCGNLLVCIVMIQQRRMRTVMNCFTLNLAISDLVIIVIYVPSQYAAYENNQNWPFGNIGCQITYSIIPVCLTTSTATLIAISWERFRGIVFPFQPRLKLTTVRKVIIITWLIGIATALPLMIIAGTLEKGNKVFCDEKWTNSYSSESYWITMFLLQYMLPLLIMSVLYGAAARKLQRRSIYLQRDSRAIAGSVNYTAEITRQRQSQKITKMLVALILIYLFCMLPQHIVYFWTKYGDLENRKYYLYFFRISNLFTMANSALNSIVYGTLQTDFRKAYKVFFIKYICGQNDKISGSNKNISIPLPITTEMKNLKKDERSALFDSKRVKIGKKFSSSEELKGKKDDLAENNRTREVRRVSSHSQTHLRSRISESDAQNFNNSVCNKPHENNINQSHYREALEDKFCGTNEDANSTINDTKIQLLDLTLLNNAKETSL